MKTILIVDDDSVTCKMLSRVFEPFVDTCKVHFTGNHREVQGIIKNQNIDLILMDLQVPGINGFQLLKMITKNCPDIPVFVMTAFGTSESKAKVEEIANCRYVEKPFDIDMMTNTILNELEKGTEQNREKKTESTIVPSQRSNKSKSVSKDISFDHRSKEIIAFLNSPITDSIIETNCTKPKKIVLREDTHKKPKQKKKALHGSSRTVKYIKTAQKISPLSPAIVAGLSKAFDKVQGINSYGIFDKKDVLHKKNTKHGSVLKIKPSIYRKISLSLKEVFNCGHLNYIVLTNHDNTRHVLFDYRNSRVVMSVKPGFHLHGFMKKIKKAKPVTSKQGLKS